MKSLVLLAAVGGVWLLLLAITNWAQTPFGGEDSGCVPDTKDHLTCSNKIAKAFGKLVTNVARCHVRQATAGFNTQAEDDETCEMAAKSKFDASLTKISGRCSPSAVGALEPARGEGDRRASRAGS